MSTTFYTQSGWSREVKVDDSVFSDLLTPYRDLGQSIPERIELSGSVAGILERDRSKYEALISYLSHSRRRRGVRKSITRLLFDNDESTLTPVPLYLHELDGLSRILNLPQGWERFVCTTEETPRDIRERHLLAQGREVAAFFGNKKWGRLVQTRDEHYSPISLTNLVGVILSDLSKSPLFSANRPQVNEILHGALRQAVLTCYYSGKDGVSVEDVPWDILYSLLSTMSPLLPAPGLVNRWDWFRGIRDQSVDSLAIFAGELPLRKTNETLPPTLSIFADWFNISIIDSPAINWLYDRVLDVIPDDVDPHQLGLSCIMYDEAQQKIYMANYGVLLTQIVAWINHLSLIYYSTEGMLVGSSLSKARLIEKSTGYDMNAQLAAEARLYIRSETQRYIVPESDFESSVKIMAMVTPGRRGLTKVVSSLTNYEGRSEKMESFLRAANKYLSENEGEGPRMRLSPESGLPT